MKKELPKPKDTSCKLLNERFELLKPRNKDTAPLMECPKCHCKFEYATTILSTEEGTQ